MPDTSLPATASGGVLVDDVRVDLGGAAVLQGVDLRVEAGQHLAILGPSGCGKTTLLRVLAGLQRVDAGRVWLGERQVAGDRLHVPAEQRRVGLVFQDWALFPHLSVAANVAYGLPRAERHAGGSVASLLGRRARVVQPVVQQLLEMVDVAELAHRLPGSLSGGQQQRVALARALAPRPSLLLLDEPFSSLDTNLRAEVRSEVAQLLRQLEMTAIFVTHDQDEAFVLGDEVAVMRAGTVVQQASPTVLYSQPVDPWLAGFVGEADLVPGDALGDCADTVLGRVPLNRATTGPVQVLLRPEEVVLSVGSQATVVEVDYHGHDALLTVATADGVRLRSRATGAPRFRVGDEVGLGHSGSPTLAYAPATPGPESVTNNI